MHERDVEAAIADAVTRAEASPWPDPGHARGWRLRRLKRSARHELLALPHYRPWFYDLVRGTSCAAPAQRLPADAPRGVENVPLEGGVVLAPMHRSYIDTLAVGVPLRAAGASVRWPSTSCSSCPLIGRAIALGGGFPVRRGVQDTEAYETAMAPPARRRHAARLPRGHPQSPRQGAAAAGRRAPRARGRRRPSCPSRSRAANASSCCRRASRGSASTTGSRSRWTICRQTTCGAHRTRRRSAGRRPSRPASRSSRASGSRSRSAQAARWSSRRCRCSCSQAWCHWRTRAA